MKRLIISLAILLSVGACGGDPPKSGEVVNKEYDAAYTYYNNTCVSYNKYGCQMYIPIPTNEPPHWKLKIKDDANSKERWIEVLPEQYNKYSIGDHWPELR